MKCDIRKDAEKIYLGAIADCLPDSVVRSVLSSFVLPKGRLILVAIGKAAWRMAASAATVLDGKIHSGAVITKYGHSEGPIQNLEIYEAGHPLPDSNGVIATDRVLELTRGLTEDDTVLFLVSGGGSALFESPECTLEELSDLTRRLLECGADINEINTVRKHISKVKGGRFAEHIRPARLFSIILSDVIGNRLDTIASGPCVPDRTTLKDVLDVIFKYEISVSESLLNCLRETPKSLGNVTSVVGGSVSELCASAKRICENMGYKCEILTDKEQGIARDVGARLATLAVQKCDTDSPLALIIGGETVVRVRGNGLGGRNQEIALAAAPIISGYGNIAVFSVGSDGTDGPTDAAGGYVDGESYLDMKHRGVDVDFSLENNDAYHALKSISSLVITGPTGTNVNDISVALIKPKRSL